MGSPIPIAEYEKVLQTAKVGVWHWDIPQDRVRWSDQTYRMLGFVPGALEVSLATWSELLHPDDRPRATETLNRFLAGDGGADYFVEHRMRRLDGSYIWVEVRGGLVRDALGRPFELIGTAVDVTPRKEAEAEAARVNEQFRLFNELASDYVYVVDVQQPSLFPSIVAGSFERTTGYTPQEVADMGGWLSVMHPDDRVAVQRVVTEVQAGRSLLSEYRIVDKHKAVRWVRDRIVPVMDPATGKLTKIMGGVTDITERKTLEAELLQAQKLEALARVTGSVAHDFNNLLVVLFAGLSALRQHQVQGTPPDTDTLTALATVAERTSELTKSMLAFGRKHVPSRRNMSVGQFVLSAMHMLRRAVGERVNLQVEIPAEDILVAIDPGQLQLALLNLSVNARDAMPDGGDLRISLSQVFLSESDRARPPDLQPGRWAVLKVTDRGIGMSPETLQHLFEPFFTTKPPGAGTGLGLATCHGIVRQLGGSIAVESRLGEGSTFSMYLPVVEAVGGTDHGPQISVTTAGTEQLILVEDDPHVRRVMSQALQLRGYGVREFESAEHVFALTNEELSACDLVISDVALPGANGVMLYDFLHARVPKIRCMLTSGHVPAASLQQRISDSGCVFLGKPFSPEALAARVRETLSRKA